MKPNALEKGGKKGCARGIKLCREEEIQSHIINLFFQPGLDEVLNFELCDTAAVHFTYEALSFSKAV